ncbi:hypothetical protein AXF42_Ash020988 [Apostasia shenzhenica]|uniref:Uncharacterized protein n=1 Tax=Apostasia shenzhenica TaxID=1088818 RepID=A0A2H9ZZV1_9ASPA|nr:hypothetical protein AXF42_Ash020988 [Apostasia shenzhenica]
MMVHFRAGGGANLRSPSIPWPPISGSSIPRRSGLRVFSSPSFNGGGHGSYLDMWKKAMDRERKSQEFLKIAAEGRGQPPDLAGESKESVERKTELFNKILDVPREQRDLVQRLQVIDRAAAAIAAARAFLRESPPLKPPQSESLGSLPDEGSIRRLTVKEIEVSSAEKKRISVTRTPGPDFWSWSPTASLQPEKQLNPPPNPLYSVVEKEKSPGTLPIPFESTLSENQHMPLLPPLQSLVEVEKANSEPLTSGQAIIDEKDKLEFVFSRYAEKTAEALGKNNEGLSHGINLDGSKWWKESGIEQRPDGVVCKWTINRGVSSDGMVEWEDKFWEASDRFDYKELGSEKSGRDALGNIWCEYWRESMWQDLGSGPINIEKTANKWGKNGKSDEWQEIWWEHYDASGHTEKWAHKWCCIDPNMPLESGHAHIWHERWGEKYDGKGGSMKYTDKWAERSEVDGWSRWGDKWDEHFDLNGHGVKQGETWWEGKHGDRWNRTWGEKHNGSGWLHKYGKSSSGEHWDTHVQQETWYERFPHYGFHHCFQNSVQLRSVGKPPQIS